MVADPAHKLSLLKVAIQMEVEGKNYYLKASQASHDELGKKLLESLAGEEDNHRQRFEEIFKAVSEGKPWPTLASQRVKNLKTIFTRTASGARPKVTTTATELDAVKVAMDLENKTYDFYQGQKDKAVQEIEKNFYTGLAKEEKRHYLALLDYYEYLKDPGGWFVKQEHPSLDGS